MKKETKDKKKTCVCCGKKSSKGKNESIFFARYKHFICDKCCAKKDKN